MGVGCHVGGLWYEAMCFAKDLILLTPTRAAAQLMIKWYEEYAINHNLQFSTDIVLAKSKSKCISMTGKIRNNCCPENLTLFGQHLPWVEQATNLGHILHRSGTMEQDAIVNKAKFIDKTVDVRETFSFAHPEQVMKAIHIYACDCYGTMLYDLSSQATESYFKAWNACVKLVWNLPRSTFTYLVEHVVAANFMSLRNQVYSRYVGHFQHLLHSSSKEVRHLARIVGRDVRSVTCRNVKLLTTVSGLSPWDYSKWRIKEKLPKATIPIGQEWRMSLLSKLLEARQSQITCKEDFSATKIWIDSLCAT